MKRSLVVLASFAALLGASSLLVREPATPTPGPAPPAQARSHQPELAHPASVAAEPLPLAPQAATAPSGEAAASNEVGPALMERLGTRLTQQGSDPEWSAAAERRALDHLGTIDGVEPVEVTCGAVMCRLEFAIAAEGQEAINKVQAAIPWHAPSVMAVEGFDETPVAVVYLAREGHTLLES